MNGLKPTSTDSQAVEQHLGSTEQAADLSALQAMAGEGVQPVGEAQEVAAAVPDLAGEIAGLVTAAVGMLAPMFPSLPGIYTPQATQAAAQAVAGVCQKHGWLQDGMMGRWGEEIACAAIVGPLAFATYQGVQADMAARKPAEPKPGAIAFDQPVAVDASMAPGAKTVSVGVPA